MLLIKIEHGHVSFGDYESKAKAPPTMDGHQNIGTLLLRIYMAIPRVSTGQQKGQACR